MLQDNPYAFDPSNPSSGGTPPPPPTPPSPPSGGFDPSASGQYMPSQPPVNNSVTPPPVFNPLNDTSNTAPAEAPTYTSSIPPAMSPDLGEAQSEGGRKAPNKKILVVLVVVLLLLGIVGGGAFALMSGLIKNPFSKTPDVVVTPPPAPVEPTPPPDPQPVPEPPPAPEPPPIQSNDDMRVSDINILATGLNSYSISHSGVYPSTGDQLTHIFPTSTPCFELIAENFIPTCPTDPAGDPAFYGYRSDGVSYELTAKLDDASCTRPGAILNGSICLYSVVGGSMTQP